jgi:hypothetical protein
MKQNVMLTVASLLTLLFLTLHLADDTALTKVWTPQNGVVWLVAVLPILTVCLYGTLVLAGRRSGYIIILIESLLGLGMPVIHLTGSRGPLGRGFFFIWTLIAIGVTSMFSIILAARGMSDQLRQAKMDRLARLAPASPNADVVR